MQAWLKVLTIIAALAMMVTAGTTDGSAAGMNPGPSPCAVGVTATCFGGVSDGCIGCGTMQPGQACSGHCTLVLAILAEARWPIDGYNDQVKGFFAAFEEAGTS